jgi:hypothetical protein
LAFELFNLSKSVNLDDSDDSSPSAQPEPPQAVPLEQEATSL